MVKIDESNGYKSRREQKEQKKLGAQAELHEKSRAQQPCDCFHDRIV
jgi:hypothetical protein